MNKNNISLVIFGIIFFFGLILYATTSSVITIILHFLLLVTGSVICLLFVNKITKSANSLRLKIYTSFILPFLIFFAVSFFWILGKERYDIDDEGLTTLIIIFPSCVIFFTILFITGTILSLKRKNKGEFNYNLQLSAKIFTAVSILMLSILFYNHLIVITSQVFKNPNLCKMSNSTYHIYSKERCLYKTAVKIGYTGSCNQFLDFGSCDIRDEDSCNQIQDFYSCYIKSKGF